MGAHKDAINTVLPMPNTGSTILATGDDEGLIKIWDLRIAVKNPKDINKANVIQTFS